MFPFHDSIQASTFRALAKRNGVRLFVTGVVVACVCGCWNAPPPEPSALEVAESPAREQLAAEELADVPLPFAGDPMPPAVKTQPLNTSPASRVTLPEPIVIPARDVLHRAGLKLIETDVVRVVTDVPGEEFAALIPMLQKTWPALEQTFGPLREDVPVPTPPLTAFVVKDSAAFQQAGLLTGELPSNIHGRHSGWQFWMKWPTRPYYQQNLFAHEAAHCYTLIAAPDVPSGWKESLAEWFATRGLEDEFGTIPESAESSRGWGRIELIAEELAAGQRYSAVEVMNFPGERFQGQPVAYAWGWALSTLLDATDHDTFVRLRRQTTQGTVYEQDVRAACEQLDRSGLWDWWIHAVDYGIDVERAAPQILHRDSIESSRRIDVLADRGWQSSGLAVTAGQSFQITAAGEIVLDETSRPWTSTPRGIRVDYADGHPLGTLLASVLSAGRWSPAVAIGEKTTWISPADGVLFFRANDHWNRLRNNSGSYAVIVGE